MSDTVDMLSFGSLFGAAVVWLGLVAWTFRRLRVHHLATYEAIGSPSLFWNNSIRTNWLFFQFLFQGQWQTLGDSRLAVVARFMRIFIVVYTIGFIALI